MTKLQRRCFEVALILAIIMGVIWVVGKIYGA